MPQKFCGIYHDAATFMPRPGTVSQSKLRCTPGNRTANQNCRGRCTRCGYTMSVRGGLGHRIHTISLSVGRRVLATGPIEAPVVLFTPSMFGPSVGGRAQHEAKDPVQGGRGRVICPVSQRERLSSSLGHGHQPGGARWRLKRTRMACRTKHSKRRGRA